VLDTTLSPWQIANKSAMANLKRGNTVAYEPFELFVMIRRSSVLRFVRVPITATLRAGT
jgi:hypothetical protein